MNLFIGNIPESGNVRDLEVEFLKFGKCRFTYFVKSN